MGGKHKKCIYNDEGESCKLIASFGFNKQIERINAEENTELLELHYLFYDGYY
jgi:hypothetical protein